MMLKELIERLERADPGHVCPVGIGVPSSWRGIYEEVAFRPEQDIDVATMLTNARSALGATFIGWKGGEFTMGEWTECHLAEPGEYPGDRLGPVLLDYMLRA